MTDIKNILLLRYRIIAARCLLLALIGIYVPVATMCQPQEILGPEEFAALVRKFHPVAKQASIQIDRAKAELLATKGNFDPLLDWDATKKTFDGKNYYDYSNPELILPLRLPLDIKTGLENNSGDYAASELSKGQTSYLGAEMSLGKGFLIDKRRAALRQARLMVGQSEQERKAALNNLLFDAFVDYWAWAGAFQQFALYNRFVQLANNRLRLVRLGFVNGDRSEMDTVEAFTQVQNFELQRLDAGFRLANARLQVSNYLWSDNGLPRSLPQLSIPDTVAFHVRTAAAEPDAIVAKATAANPVLKAYEWKIKGLETEKRLKFQNLLPYFTVKGNLLSKGYYAPKDFSANYYSNNYKWGIALKMPLLLREGRGDYRKATLKLQEASLELANKKWQTENKVRSYHAENTALGNQVSVALRMYANYNLLLRNEELKFEQGESSLFLVNSRETKVLEAAIKLVELNVKYQKAKYAVDWAAGLLE